MLGITLIWIVVLIMIPIHYKVSGKDKKIALTYGTYAGAVALIYTIFTIMN